MASRRKKVHYGYCLWALRVPLHSHDTTLPRKLSPMRCYFMKHGHIAGVEFMHCKTDEACIEEAREAYKLKGEPRGAEGFEVWDGPRFLYRYPPAYPPP